jgi:adenylosuccinate lyase
LHFSQRVLLALTQVGVSREDAYRLVQSNAMEVWDSIQKGNKISFKDKILADSKIAEYLSPKDIATCFDEQFYVRHAKKIWKRVLDA